MTGNPESQQAPKHVERIAVLCWIMLGMHLLAAVGIVVNLLLYLGGDRTLHGQSSAFREGQAMGQVVGIALGLTVHGAGAIWAPLNAYALAARRRGSDRLPAQHGRGVRAGRRCYAADLR